MLVAGAVLEGLSRALYSGNNDALLYESLRNDGEFAHRWGLVNSLLRLSTAFAAPLGSMVAAHSMQLVVDLSGAATHLRGACIADD